MNMRDDNMITERYMSDPEGAVLVQERSENSRKKGKSATGAKPQVKKTAPRGKAEKAKTEAAARRAEKDRRNSEPENSQRDEAGAGCLRGQPGDCRGQESHSETVKGN